MLELTPDELLTTTRTVRKRLDLARPVPRALIEECLGVALQAPNGGNLEAWRWIAVDDRASIRELARLYNEGIDAYVATFGERGYPGAGVPGADRIAESTQHLRDHFAELPALVLPLAAGRTDVPGANVFHQASVWGSLLPAVWSFMLALRARGLGSAWTTAHLWREREVAALLGIPHGRYMQAGLFPVAFTLGTAFQPARRKPVSEVLRWNSFEGRASA
ncbi:MAG TPA: nitroreductase family protein [Myxococcota bacterium]|nr:nitroreductase family protein [Myxococcota bacterium]